LDKQESELFDELMAVEQELLDCVDNLISVKWDSNTIKLEIQELMKQRNQLQRELFEIDDKRGT
jgi:seryl-tRNA synthetase